MAKGDDIQERLINLAVGVVKLSGQLVDAPASKHLGMQLLRSGTSPAANYAEARGGESGKDFIHKLKLVLKELNETSVWLEVLKRSELAEMGSVTTLHRECTELSKIINASIQTAKRNT